MAIRMMPGEVSRDGTFVDTVGIEEAVAFGNLIAFAARAEKIEGIPQARLEKKKLEQSCGEGEP